MKLYYSPGACSLSCDIALQESGVKFTREKVDLKTKKTETGKDFNSINPKGYVPTLELDNGEILTECSVILQYIADKAPEKQLAPLATSFERYRLQEILIFLSTEIHKSFGPFFSADAPDKTKEMAREKITSRLKILEERLNKSAFLMGEQYTVADPYLFTLSRWLPKAGLKIEQWPSIAQFFETVKARPAVADTLKAEGIS